jgi:hypothetical protein
MAFAGALAAVNMAIVNSQKRTCPICGQQVSDRDDHAQTASGQRTHTRCAGSAS